MCRSLLKILTIVLIAIAAISCTKSRVKNACRYYLNDLTDLRGLSVGYPKKNTLFPVDFQAPTFRWTDSSQNNSGWFACISDPSGNILLEKFIDNMQWRPDSTDWESLKQDHTEEVLRLSVIGYNKKDKGLTGGKQSFQISKDSVGADIFFRAVTLPFSFAVRNVQTIEWYLGSVQGGAPKKMLDNMPVCANCHSFSPNGPTLAMDVDYGNDKGSYALVRAKDTCSITPEDIITWDNFKKDEGDPTFGLLSQISPSGKYVLSTVKDLSVFVAVDDNLAYSQLFFPTKGIIGIYNVESETFSELEGANDPEYVQSNPVWSPDNKKILFARTTAYINQKVRKYGNALLSIDDVKEFKQGHKEFKFDIYSVNFNDGMGGVPQPLKDASFNGKSNYFPKYSPDGRWIVFCKADNFMLLQPDSKLYIMNADGTNARLMNCNTDNMNSWHSWSPNGHWLVFSSKQESLYTRLYLTHIDENGNDSPPVLLENLVFGKRAANIPEFFPGNASEFVKIKDDFSNSAPYYTRLAMDNIRSRYYLKADRNLRHAIDLDPNYIDSYILKIYLNSILQQVNSRTEKVEKAKALSILNDQIGKDKANNELLLLKANLLISTGDYEEAEKILNAIIVDSPAFYRAYDQLVTIYKKKNKPDEVIRIYNKMIALVPANELDIRLAMANFYLSGNKTSEALKVLQRMSRKYPRYDEIHINLCKIYTDERDLSAADKEVDFLIGQDSTNYSYYFMKSEIARVAGKAKSADGYYLEGTKYMDQKLEENKENIPLAFEKADMLKKNRDLKGALEIYNNVLKDLPSNYQALKEKARIMLMMQQWQDAINLYEKLLSNYNEEEEFYNNAAIACIKLGNYEDALKQFTNSIRLNPSNTDALFNRAKVYDALGDTRKAKKDLDNIRQILQAKKNLTEDEKRLLKSI